MAVGQAKGCGHMFILVTKLHAPSLPPSLVPRERLLDRLDQALACRLTLVSAPAGFGKTILLGQWARRLEGSDASVRVAWISLDDGDNDPARFAAYLAAALHPNDEGARPPDQGAARLGGPPLKESHLVLAINEVAALPGTVVLVLDDYHAITSRVVHDAVAYLVDHCPDNLHLVLATRADPPLPLPRLRASGHLAEVRQSDLRFTPEECAAFLNSAMGLGLSAHDLASLAARTEGWIAGLQMAALSLQGHDADPAARSGFVRAFTGSHRFVLDYLAEEVLEKQPPAVQEFLLRTSILERLCASLCDAVIGAGGVGGPGAPPGLADSQSILEHLEAANLFIVPLDDERRWYRYHRLFVDLLRKRLGQTSPNLVPELHRRASAWHEREGLIAAAIDHALAARDDEHAADLIERHAEATMMLSEVTTLLGWVGSLPDDLVRARPTLAFYHTLALAMSGSPMDAVEGRLRDVARAQADGGPCGIMAGRTAALHAYLMLFRPDMDRAVALCHQALEQLPEGDRFLRSVVAWILSLARVADGDLEDGQRALAEVVQIGRETANPLIAVSALCHQARLQTRQGHLQRACEMLERALELATDPRGRRLPIASKALIDLGDLARERNDLAAAERDVAEGLELARQWSELATFDAYFPLARTRLARGDLAGAREAIETARRIARRSEATAIDDAVVDLQHAYLCIRTGDLAEAERWARRRGLLPYALPGTDHARDVPQDYVSVHLRKYEHLVLARLFIAQGRAADALQLSDGVLAEARQLARTDLTLQSLILRALAHQAQGDDEGSLDALSEALSLAEPCGYVRTFLDEGEPMATLLRKAASRAVSPAYASTLLAAFGGPGPLGQAPPPSGTSPAPPRASQRARDGRAAPAGRRHVQPGDCTRTDRRREHHPLPLQEHLRQAGRAQPVGSRAAGQRVGSALASPSSGGDRLAATSSPWWGSSDSPTPTPHLRDDRSPGPARYYGTRLWHEGPRTPGSDIPHNGRRSSDMGSDGGLPGAVYEIRIRGELGLDWEAYFGGLAVTFADADDRSPVTVLTGIVADQAALRGILCRLWDLNLVLVSVRRIAPAAGPEG